MIFPTVRCQIISYTEQVDDYGRQTFSSPFDSACSVVRLTTATKKTSVRTDSSGTGGSAKEIQADAILLFSPETNLKKNDRVDINGISLRVVEVQIRYGVFSNKPDHLEVDLEIWV